MKNKTITKSFYLGLVFILSFSFSHTGKAQKTANGIVKQQDLVFFKGDSLNGFPLENELNKCQQLAHKPGELYEYKNILKNKEANFVKQKYHIDKLPYEIAFEQEMKRNEKSVITESQKQAYRQNNPAPQPLASTCNNLDFENGNFTNWNGYEGYNKGSNNPLATVVGPIAPPTNLNSAETSCNYFSIMTGGTDPNTGISLTSPLGGNCARMGGENRNYGDLSDGYVCAGNNQGGFTQADISSCVAATDGVPIGTVLSTTAAVGEELETTFMVTNANSAFQYAYLFVYLDNGAHDTTQQPYFKVQVLDQSGNELSCLNYYQEGLGNGCTTHNPPGYQTDGAGLYWTNGWQVSSLNLKPYLSTNVTVRYTVAGCTRGGHFGYAYVDGACSPQQIIIPNTACQGQNATLIAPTIGNAVYQWNTSTGNIVSGATTQTITANQSGTYSVTITPTRAVLNGAGNVVTQTLTACAYMLDTTITVYPNPTVSVNSATLCLGTNATLSVTSTGSAAPLTFSWSTAAGLTYTSGDTVATASPPSTTIYTITGTSVYGCKDTAVAHVTVNVEPPPTFTAPAVCMGTPTIFSNNVTVGDFYQWNFGDTHTLADTADIANPSYTYTYTGNFSVSFSVTTAAGCKSNVTQTVTVNPMPTIHFTANHPCDGSAVNFVNTTPNQASFSTWHWDFNDGNVNNTAAPGAYTYTAPAGFSAAGCYSVVLTGTTTTGCAGSFDTIVYVHNNPFAYFTGFYACLGDPTDFVDSSFVQNPACLSDQITSWNYDFGDGQQGNYTPATLPDTIKHTYATCGAYNISATVTTNNGCTFTNTLTGDTVFCLPVVTAPPSFSICPGVATTPQTFTSTVTNGGPAFTVWFTDYPVTNTGMNINDTLGYDVFPSYPTIPKNLSCAPVSDMVYGIAASSYCIGNIDSLQITVKPTPVLNHMDTIKVCNNQQVTVPAFVSCPVGATNAWTNNTTSIGLAAAGNGNINPFTGVNATNAVVDALVTVTPTLNGCTGPDSTFNIVVSPSPTMTVSSFTACPGTPVPSPTITTFDPNVHYHWTATNNVAIGMPLSGTVLPAPYTAPANNSLAAQIGVITYTPALNGCIGTPATGSITINPTPVVTPRADSSYCPGQTVAQINFTCTPTGGIPTFTYTGLGGIGLVFTGDSIASFTATNSTTSTIPNSITVGVTLNGCQGIGTSFNLNVYPNPVANFNYSPVCYGDPVNFTDASVANGGFSVNAWQWTSPGGVFSNNQNPSHVITPTGTPVNLLIHTNSVPSCTAQTTQSITINPNPVASFMGNNLKGCPKVTTTFTDLSTPTGSITGWNWNLGNNQTSSSSSPQTIYSNTSATQPKFYSVSLIVTTAAGCSDTAQINNYVEVYPKPIAGFSWNPKDADLFDPTIIFVNQAIGADTYTPTLTYGQYGVEYYLGDTYTGSTQPNNMFNNTTFSHSYNNPDLPDVEEFYNVTQWVINSYGCIDSVTEIVNIEPIVTFYIPNAFTPNGDNTNDGFKGTGIGIKKGTYNLWIFDRWGLMIYHADDLEKAWDGHMQGHEGQAELQEDVYVWKVKFNDILNKSHDYHGTVTLIK